jgi:hypothetical protein
MDMGAIEECSSDGGQHQGSRILVGVPNNSRGCSELLSWAIRVVAKPNDSVVAVHVLGNCLEILPSRCCSCMDSCSCLDDYCCRISVAVFARQEEGEGRTGCRRPTPS